MSEGTMQRAAQRDDQCDHRDQRDRRAGRLRRALVCATAVPAVLVVAGCSSNSGSQGSDAKASASGSTATATGTGSASPSPTVQAAAYRTLPSSCAVLSKKILGELVPKGVNSGKAGSSTDTSSRSSCSWNSLADNGVKGSQFRWLNVSLLRFDSSTGRGSANEQAQAYYTSQVQSAKAASGAKNVKSQPLGATGDEATEVRYDLNKKEGDFKQQTVVARVENVVVTLDYNGAGLAGDTTPNADDLATSAQQATKAAVASVTSTNAAADTRSASPTKSTSKSTSKSASTSASKSPSPSKSAPKSPSPSASASKKS
jgi:hypothetical protein